MAKKRSNYSAGRLKLSLLRQGSAVFLFFLAGCALPAHSPEDREGLLDYLARSSSTSVERLGPKARGRLSAQELEEASHDVSQWRWPLKDVEVSSGFGHRHGSFHEGIDLRAGIGTPIYAAAKGRVTYTGSRISGYGRMVVLKHKGGYFTIYAHQSSIAVRVGQKVKKGQLLGKSGNSGRTSGPHLHFEVRKGTLPLNPARLLKS